MLVFLKRPSGFLPLAISGAFLLMLLAMWAQGRLVHQRDEGAGAHLFQILMPLQLLLMLFFAITWVPRTGKPALQVLAMQAVLTAAVFAVVYFRHL